MAGLPRPCVSSIITRMPLDPESRALFARGLIERAFFRGLVFNQSWEDPELDRAALRIKRDRDTVLTITSGGCNALSLLCLEPRRLISIDSNPAQTYLLELKLAAIRRLEHRDFFTFFASGDGAAAARIYRTALRGALPSDARAYWDRNVRMLERGLLTQGKLGLFLRLLRLYLRRQLGEARLCRLFEAETLEEQRELYDREVRSRLWRGPIPGMLRLRPVLALAGMHPAQYDLIRDRGGIEAYVRQRIEHVLNEVPLRDNYFLAQAALGRYLDAERVPPYLREQNFATLRRTVDRVTNVTGSLREHLDSLPADSVEKLSLLDVFDWMDGETFRATLRSVLRAAANGGRFVYRSTVRSLPVPAELGGVAVGEPELARRLHARDRSATYGSFYVYRVEKELRRARTEKVDAAVPQAPDLSPDRV